LLSVMLVLGMSAPYLVSAEEDPPLIKADSRPIIVDYIIDEDLQYWENEDDWKPWHYSADPAHSQPPEKHAYISGNSYTAYDGSPHVPSVSNIALTVSGVGRLVFDYRMEPTVSGGGVWVFVGKLHEPVTLTNYTENVFYSDVNQIGVAGRPGWLDSDINIEESDLDGNRQVTIYFAYVRTGSIVNNSNFAALANIAYYSDEVFYTFDLNIVGNDYGHVVYEGQEYDDATQSFDYPPNKPITLLAVAESGGQFYGWKDSSGTIVSYKNDYSFVLSESKEVTAVFAPEGHYVARRNLDQFYSEDEGGLEQALSDASSGDYVLVLEDYFLTSDSTVPSGVKLYVPYREQFEKYTSDFRHIHDEEGYADGQNDSSSYFHSSRYLAPASKTYRTLTIDEGVTLEVKGTLYVGSVISHPSQYYQGHTSGWHGKIVNNGNIVVKAGGVLDSWGIITGSGTVTVVNGGEAYEPFMVLDFAGGSNSEHMYINDLSPQSPFKQYAMQNIQSKLVIHSGATLYAHCNLYALESYNKTDVAYVGADALFQPSPGSIFTRTYNGATSTERDPDIGVMTYTFDGGMTMNRMAFNVWGVEIGTEVVDFPIPQSINFVFKNGNYNAGRTKLMPGAIMRVESDAHLEVSNTLYILDGLIESAMGGNRIYSTTGKLQEYGYSGSANLILNGSMTIKSGAKFGGIIQTEADSGYHASIVVESGADVVNSLVYDGALGWTSTNISKFAMPARVRYYDRGTKEYSMISLEAGKTYQSYNANTWQIDSYTMDYATSCSAEDGDPSLKPWDPKIEESLYKWELGKTVVLEETRYGSWSEPFSGYTVNVTNRTTNDANDATKALIEVDEEVPEGESLVFTVTSTPAGIGYVHLVTYQLGEEPPIILSPEDGEYTIGNVQDNISIQVTSCLLGDLNGSGNINNLDLVQMRKILAGGYQEMTPIKSLAADLTQDGKTNNLDLVRLRKALV